MTSAVRSGRADVEVTSIAVYRTGARDEPRTANRGQRRADSGERTADSG